MQDVFIAHDRADVGIAEAYARALKKLGYECAWDAGGVVNDDWAERALATVKGARCVIALWSPRSVTSEHVTFWATSAAAQGKLISISAYGDAEPRILAHLGTINLAGWDYVSPTPSAELLFAALKRHTKKAPKREPARAPVAVAALLPHPTLKPSKPASPRLRRADWLMWLAGAAAAPIIAVSFFFLGSELRQAFDREQTAPANAQTVAPALTASAIAAPAAPTGPRRFAGEENLVTLAELERYDWQAVALRIEQRIGEGGAAALQEKAATGDPAAQFELCVAHLQGIAGLAREGAHAPCAASAAQAHPAGLYLAWMLRDRAGIGYDDARRHLIAAADGGWAPAQRLLAGFHRNRQEGFTPDATRERALLSAAAAENYPRAMFDFASLYLRRGSAEDRALAATYLERVMADREFGLCAQARRVLVQMGEEPPACRR
ncbi:hypothetical protein U91I_00043 [alpha proteobacterium U9-1i]|nr:hypothetical protein U91I_00043 [alpha proteobacterium U9-1i]